MSRRVLRCAGVIALSVLCLGGGLVSSLWAAENVLTLGLKGDGTSDDTDALQKALDGTHGALFFGPGEYFFGPVNVPGDTTLIFDPRAKIKVNVARVVVKETVEDGKNKGKMRIVTKPLFNVTGNRVRIEGLRFDFASGGTPENDSPIDVLVEADHVSDVTVSGIYAETSYPREMIPLEKRNRVSIPTKRAGTDMSHKGSDTPGTVLRAQHSRNIVVENSGGMYIMHLLHATDCENVSSHGNWMISGNTITTFDFGSGSLRHYDNWSRNVHYQVVWRGGSPDPSRKAPKVPLGTANVVIRGPKEGDPGWIPHTTGVFDVLVQNNYAEYGMTLAWGNKGRQVIIDGNTARFIADYSYGIEGGENTVFSNNISINSTSGGIVSMYWGDKLLIIGNQLITRHETWNPEYSNYAKPTSYLGGGIRLHHGPSNPEDMYGAGTTLITENLISNELTAKIRRVSIQGSRDVTIANNKFVNSGCSKSSKGKLIVLNNEFISRMDEDPSMISFSQLDLAIIRGNVFRKEKPIEAGTELQKASEQEEVPYFLFTEKTADAEEDTKKKDDVPAAISLRADRSFFGLVQDNSIIGWKTSVYMANSKKSKASCVVTGNTVDGAVTIDDAVQALENKIVKNNRTLPAGLTPESGTVKAASK